MIENLDGNVIGYIPLFVVAGGETNPFTIRIVLDLNGGELKSGQAEIAALWGRIGAGAYQELFTNPLDLNAYANGSVDVQIKAKADADAVGLNRVFNSLNVGNGGSAAGWNT
jgi:hypothetical protein